VVRGLAAIFGLGEVQFFLHCQLEERDGRGETCVKEASQDGVEYPIGTIDVGVIVDSCLMLLFVNVEKCPPDAGFHMEGV
jgi:hypothetical protein